MLEINKVTKIYNTAGFTQKALDSVSIKFRENEFVSILGPSGSGKTTLLNIVGGLDHYTKGDLIINGKSTKKYKDSDWDVYRNRSIGFVFQSYNLIAHQSVIANVELALTLSGISKDERRKRAYAVLKEVGLEDHIYKKPSQLSGGQMQRVAIARALINNPDILLADEPTGALDSKTSIQIMKLLKEIAKDKLVIMVTHNPELANNYSTRIVSLADGKIIDDTNPFDGQDEENTTTTKFRTHMSFMTALGLSLNNLMTKKGRTILTAFAGSIGIIGIALILSLSNGIQDYIDRVQKETLASYPLQLTEENVDSASMITSLMLENTSLKEHGLDKIYSNNILTEMVNNLNSSVDKNNLKAFKKYLEKNEDKFKKYTTAISYKYPVVPQIYRSNTDTLVQVNPSQIMTKMGFADMIDIASSMAFTGVESSNYDVFSEIIDNDDLNKQTYDMIAGVWPEKYNEVILFVNDKNEISDYTLYALGILSQDSIEDNLDKIMAGEKIDTPEVDYTYEELLGLDLTLVLNSSYYDYNKKTRTWMDKRNDEKYLKQLVKNGEKLKVVGIARPTDESNQKEMGSIGYLPSLVTHIIEENNKSTVAKKQRENEKINIFTGMKFSDNKKFDIKDLTPEQQAYLASLSPEELTKMIEMYSDNANKTFEDNLVDIGSVDFDKPSSINIYPIDFESKENIQDLIKEYNDSVKEEDVINYTDFVGILMQSVTSIVNTISYVLIAFVAISLIVSSIMIGIITYISVLERTKEIGILRAIGASKKDISRVFNAETFIEGTIAGLIGIGITLLLNIPINIIIKNITDISNVAMLPTTGAIILVVISMILTMIAGLIPSKMASKKDPVEALRTE